MPSFSVTPSPQRRTSQQRNLLKVGGNSSSLRAKWSRFVGCAIFLSIVPLPKFRSGKASYGQQKFWPDDLQSPCSNT